MITSYAVPRGDDVPVTLQPYTHKLRPRQQAILEFVYTYTQQAGHPPSLREIGDAVGMTSTSVINYNVKQLIRWHFLKQAEGKSRSILLAPAGYHAIDQATPEEIQADRLRLVIENRRLIERCQTLEARCRELLRSAAS